MPKFIRCFSPLALAASLLLAACTHYTGNHVRVLGPCSKGSTVCLTVGQTVAVALPSNPSTGYLWQVKADTLGGLKQLGDRIYLADSGNSTVGSGGTDLFRFQAASAGTFKVELDYLKPWETSTPPAKTWTATFVVSAAK
jgi:inhibitor of cysteine peptidase